MIIPSYVTIYDGPKKLKVGTECPKHLEEQLQKAIDAKMAQAHRLAERFAPYKDEEVVINNCSQYPEFNNAVMKAYKTLRAKKVKKEKEKDSKK